MARLTGFDTKFGARVGASSIAGLPTRHRTSLTGVLLVVLICLGLVTSSMVFDRAIAFGIPEMPIAKATGVEQLRQQQQQIEQQRSRINQAHDRLRTLEGSAQQHLGGLQNRIQTTAAQITQNEAQLKAANQKLRQLEADLAKAEQSYQQRQVSTVARLQFLQRQQGSRGWAVLLQSQNLNEFLDRRYQLKRLYQTDRQVLAQLKSTSDDISHKRIGVANQQNQIALISEQLQTQKSEFQAQAATQSNLVDRLRQDRRALEAAETQLAQDSTNLTTLIRDRLAAASPANRVYGTGRFIFPSDAAISSSFGMRIHPILGYRRFHSGVDFGAEYGSSIRAADSGTVIFAGWYGGYGQAVIIDHGNNTTTLYGHTSEIYVTDGEAVQRGQPIAAVGSTGFSTGPHLHFEVRQNGEPVDPMPFL